MIKEWAYSDTQKRFNNIVNGCIYLISKPINIGLYDGSNNFNDVSNNFKPNYHTTGCQIITIIFLFLFYKNNEGKIKRNYHFILRFLFTLNYFLHYYTFASNAT